MAADSLAVLDDDGNEVVLDGEDADALAALTDTFDAATVSACPSCRSRVVSCVMVIDVLEAAPPLPRGADLLALADDAPTGHLYLEDLATSCRHERWRDPGRTEWTEALAELAPERGRR